MQVFPVGKSALQKDNFFLKKVLTLPFRRDIMSKNNKGYDEDGRVIPLSENRWLVQTDSVNFDKTYHFRAGVPKSNRLVDFSRVRCVNA